MTNHKLPQEAYDFYFLFAVASDYPTPQHSIRSSVSLSFQTYKYLMPFTHLEELAPFKWPTVDCYRRPKVVGVGRRRCGKKFQIFKLCAIEMNSMAYLECDTA